MKLHIFSDSHMNTKVNISIYSNEDRFSLEPYTESVWKIFDAIEQRFSIFLSTSELSHVNQHSGEVIHVSMEMLETIQYAVDLTQRTQQTFNPIKGNVEWPNQIIINQEASTVQIPNGSFLDLNAIVKGLAIDCALRVFPSHMPILLEAGGDIKVQGLPPGERAWNIGIRDPKKPDKLIASFPMSSGAICTSGLYFRGNHLSNNFRSLNSEITSVTILAPTAQEADGLSTALFFFEIEQALDFIDQQQGISCCIIDHRGHAHLNKSAYQLLSSSFV